jgi:hypothetical protein
MRLLGYLPFPLWITKKSHPGHSSVYTTCEDESVPKRLHIQLRRKNTVLKYYCYLFDRCENWSLKFREDYKADHVDFHWAEWDISVCEVGVNKRLQKAAQGGAA